MRTLLILTLLFAPAFAQQPGFLQPVRVAVGTQQSEDEADVSTEAAESVRRELRKLRNVAIVQKRADFLVQVTARKATGVGCHGYVGAVSVVNRERAISLQAFTGATVEALAGLIVEESNRHDFEPWRQREVSKR